MNTDKKDKTVKLDTSDRNRVPRVGHAPIFADDEDFTTLAIVYFVKVHPFFFSVKIAFNLQVKDFSHNVA